MPTADAAGQRRLPRGRRRLRTRIIVTITLLGFCLTALFAYSTTLLRTRVENQLL
ncbi:MAG TPA: two-component sensor histidine kinase, partial [Thermomonas sp.]|nr:two-component sensor histidine kinase [Thermomonas sp.]